MVLEFLGDSLLRLIRYNHYKGLKINKVREICRCILTGLDYLHRELGMIHSDLKPENILLCSTIDPAKDPVRSGLTPLLEKPEGNANGGGSSMNLIEKKLKRRAKRAVAKISERRVSMVGATGEEASSKTERSLDGIDMRCKVVDFGNACWADKQFAEEIQTRQYRAPEVILKSGYSFSVDMWSFGCTAFELVTGDMLFAPKDGNGYGEDEDHLALMMELLGKMPRKIAIGGAKSKDYFDRHGDLKRIRRLKYWPLDRLLIDKYKLPEAEAKDFAEFLTPILEFAPEKRPTAQQCLEHPWMNVTTQDNADNIDAQMNNLEIKG
ncbi:Protein kinase-like domain superfamily [Arabidopsis suecica]|nr:Protein kinase-like domain superfamily [Arabidopsis suecica]